MRYDLPAGPSMTGPTHPVILGWRLDPATRIRVETVYLFDFLVQPAISAQHRLETDVLVVYASARTGRLGVEYVDNFEVELRPGLRFGDDPGPIQVVEGRESDGGSESHL